MTAITLDGETYDYIVDVLFSESNDVTEGEFLNQDDVTLDETVWNRGPLKITYILRLTSAQKWVLDQLLLAHTAVNLTDTKYGINNNVWVSNIETEWNPDNHNYPWTLTLDLVLVE